MQAMISKYMRMLQGVLTATQAIDNSIQRNREVYNFLCLLNYGGMFFVLFITSVVMLTSYFVTIPFYYTVASEASDSLWKGRLLAVYFYVNIVLNYILILYGGIQSIYCSRKDLPMFDVSTQEDWTKCDKCDRFVPPRTRHCSICDRCILKRDHHCFFTGCCVGFYNQRYFIMYNLHGALSCLAALWYLKTYLGSHYVELLSEEFFKYTLPYALIAWILGYTTFQIFLMVILFYLILMTGVMCAYFVIWQGNLMIGGQTSYEFVKGNKYYQSNIPEHLRSVFGPYWALNILFPMPQLKQENDGTTWSSSSTKFL